MVVETNYGKIDGVEQDGCYIYKGIPYAAPPVGSLRFARPRKPDAWEGVYMADHFRSKSVQRKEEKGSFYQKEFYDNPDFEVPADEDCLYLNIWRPANTQSNLPVAVYVHGGAFMGGTGSSLPFVGSYLAKKGIVLVTINYRLGVWGFLSHPLLEESGANGRGNCGLWDQIAAFTWVKENIAAFGGNPDNVTAFGQSAGAMSLQVLALSSVTKGLFQRMILQSGGGYQNPLTEYRTQEQADVFGEQLLAALGVEGWQEDESRRQAALDKLYEGSVDELQEAAGEVLGKSFQAGTGLVYTPIIDGELLTDNLNARIESGGYHDIPYILGANANDITTEGMAQPTQENNPMHLANVAYAERVNQRNANDCYVYYFARRLPSDDSGAFHSAELWYVFGSLDYCWREMEEHDYELSEEMMECWCSFMRNGDPNGDGEREWKPCTKENGYVKIFE